MGRIKKKPLDSFLMILRSSLKIFKTFSKITAELLRRGIKELLVELALFGIGLGLSVILSFFGLSNSFALGLSISIVIIFCILCIRFFSPRQSRLARREALGTAPNRLKGEEKLADWIAQTLTRKAPQEWEEYQDWLHDILLARLHLLDRGYPLWKVRMITYGRLTVFCLTVILIKLRRLATSLRA
ncbi:MAG: hypothetical protein AB4368_26000 [Xenococcaceae cyanobacterium]